MAYARYLNLDLDEVLKAFERESAIYQSKQPKSLSYQKSFKESRFIITPKLLAYSALSLFVFMMLSYIVYQVSGFAGSPNLEIMSPRNNIVFEEEDINVAGMTDTDAFVSVNDENIPVTSDGRFSLNLRLHRGVNVISVRATNKAKKESSKVYTVEYRPKTAEATEVGSSSSF